MSEMDLEGLSTFVLLAEHGSGSQVAKLQGLSQAAVSQRISRVESSYGVRLFVRCDEGMVLTEEGMTLLPMAKKVLDGVIDLGVSVTREIRNEGRIVKILIDRSMRGDRLARCLNGDERFEVVRVQQHSQWRKSLQAGELDLVFQSVCGIDPALQGIARIELGSESGATFAWNPETFPLAADVGIYRLLREPLIIPSERLVPGFDRFLEFVASSSMLKAELMKVEVESESEARDACSHGIGILFFPGNASGRLSLEADRMMVRSSMEFASPKAYSTNLFVSEKETRAHVLEAAKRLKEVRGEPGE